MIQDRIRELIKALALTANSFSARSGIQQSIIHNIVSGRGNAPRWETYEKILEAVPEVSTEWLSRGVGPMFLDPAMQQAHEAERQAQAAIGSGNVQTGDITLSGANNKIYSGGSSRVRNNPQGDNALLSAALAKCQQEKEGLNQEVKSLEVELRRSKDQIIDLLMGKTDKT